MPHLYAAPQHVGFRVWHRTSAIARFWPYRTGVMQDLGYGLPRIHLLGTWVNKGERVRPGLLLEAPASSTGWGFYLPPPGPTKFPGLGGPPPGSSCPFVDVREDAGRSPGGPVQPGAANAPTAPPNYSANAIMTTVNNNAIRLFIAFHLLSLLSKRKPAHFSS